MWRFLCKSGLLSRIVQSRHYVLFVIVGVNKFVTVIVLVKSPAVCSWARLGNDYSDEFIDTNKYKHDKHNDVCANTATKTELTTVSLPYIRGTSETIARILKPFNIRIAHKPTRTLRHLLTNVKDKDDPKDRQGTVYRIRCNDCNGTYIGETGRTLTTRLGEHQAATDKEDLTNNIAQHHRKTGHDISWDSATCLTYSTDKDQRLTLESWFTNLQPNPLNRSRKLPAAYERLLQSKYRTADENAD